MDPDTLLNKDNQVIAYYTLYSEIKLNNITAIALELANRVYSYTVTTINTTIDIFPINIDLFAYNITLYYTSTKFVGIIINIKASKHFTAEYNQFLTLQKINKVQLNKSIKSIVSVQFKIGSISSIGFIKVATPINTVEFYIIKVNTPFLLYLADIDNLQVYFNNLKNILITPLKTVLVIHQFRHLFLLQDTLLYVFITKSFN